MDYRSPNNSKGIDVSKYQGNIKWSLVANAGISFVFMKATQGTTLVDMKLNEYYQGAKSVNLPVGYYHYCGYNDPIKEANHFVNTVQGNGLECDLAYVLDIEDNPKGYSRAQISQWARTFLQRVQELTGKAVFVYTGASFAKTNFEPDLGNYPLWIAQYGISQEPKVPSSNSVWSNWTVFQYSEKGKISGITDNFVDLNEWNGNVWDWINAQNRVEDHIDTGVDEEMNPMQIPDWAWTEIDQIVGDAYNEGIIEQWDWVQKVRDKQMTLTEFTLVKVLIDERRRKKALEQ